MYGGLSCLVSSGRGILDTTVTDDMDHWRDTFSILYHKYVQFDVTVSLMWLLSVLRKAIISLL